MPLRIRYIFIIFLVIFLYFIGFSVFRINDTDEGYIVTASMRIMNGELPYRDFFLHTPPVTYYAVAAAFKIFGQYLIVDRILTAILGLFISILLYLISRRVIVSNYSLIPSIIFMFWGTGQVNIPSFAWFGLFFSLISVYAFVLFIERRRPGLLVIAGLFSGLAFMSKQNLGLCVLMVSVLALAIDRFLKNYFKERTSYWFLARDVIFITFSFSIPTLLIGYFFYLKGSLPHFIKYVFMVAARSGLDRIQVFPFPSVRPPQLIIAAIYAILFYFGVRHFRKKKTIFPFNIFMGIFLSLIIVAVVLERAFSNSNYFLDHVKTGAIRGFFNFLVISCIISAVLSLISINKKKLKNCVPEISTLFLSAFALLYIWAGLFISRDMVHHIYSLPPTFILAGYLFYRIKLYIFRKRGGLYRAYLKYIIIFPLLFILILGFVTNLNNEVFRDSSMEMPLYKLQSFVRLERAKYILTDTSYASDIEGLVDFIDYETGSKEKIFYSFFPDSEIFFLADRMPSSFFNFLYGDCVKASDQDRIIRDLDSDNTRLIFLPKDRFERMELLSNPVNNSNTYEIEAYMGKNYKLKMGFGRFVVLERKVKRGK